jgi:inner membrane protein
MHSGGSLYMDPLTQGLLGAAAAQVCVGHKLSRTAWLVGGLTAMSADLDVVLATGADDLVRMAYHRHFSHALVFIPVAAAGCAQVFMWWPGYRGARWWVFFSALVGYATHATLDACTNYGTLLYWPFTDARVAWDFIAIIDPVFSVCLLVGLIAGAVARNRTLVGVGLALACIYMAIGAANHHIALDAQRQLAESRGHTITRSMAAPTLGNIVLWRSVYEHEGVLYADAVRTPWVGPVRVHGGAHAKRIRADDLSADLPDRAAVIKDFKLFDWFANGYVAYAPGQHDVIGDMRYSSMTEDFAPLWGLMLNPNHRSHGQKMVGLGPPREMAINVFLHDLVSGHPDEKPLNEVLQR